MLQNDENVARIERPADESPPFDAVRSSMRVLNCETLGERLRTEFVNRDYRSMLSTLDNLGQLLQGVKRVPYESLASANTPTLLNALVVTPINEYLLEATLKCLRLLSSSPQYAMAVDAEFVCAVLLVVQNLAEDKAIKAQFALLSMTRAVDKRRMQCDALFVLANVLKHRTDVAIACVSEKIISVIYGMAAASHDRDIVSGALACFSGMIDHDNTLDERLAANIGSLFVTYYFDSEYDDKALCLDCLVAFVSRYPKIFVSLVQVPLFSGIACSLNRQVVEGYVHLLVAMFDQKETAQLAHASFSWSHIDAFWSFCKSDLVVHLIDSLVVFDNAEISTVKQHLSKFFSLLSDGTCKEQTAVCQLFVHMAFFDAPFLTLWASKSLMQDTLHMLSSDSLPAIHACLSLLNYLLTRPDCATVFTDPSLPDALAGVPPEYAELAESIAERIRQI